MALVLLQLSKEVSGSLFHILIVLCFFVYSNINLQSKRKKKKNKTLVLFKNAFLNSI